MGIPIPNQKELLDFIFKLSSPEKFIQEAHQKLEEERKKREYFYNEVAEFKKSEFILGEIIIHSPVKKEHNDVLLNLLRLVDSYVRKHKLGYIGVEKVLIALSRNDYEPDLCFFTNEKAKEFEEGKSIFPAPDLVVEILSKSTKKNDYGIKFEDYLAHNVKEYLIIDPIKKVVELYRIDNQSKKEKEYELILKSGTGILKSEVIQDFEIRIESIFDAELSFEELNRILKK
jgi:Uma2 family endonuclease